MSGAETTRQRQAFKCGQRLQLAVFPGIVAHALLLLFRTCRVETRNREHYEDAIRRHGRCHMAVWHESMAMAGCYYRGFDYLTLTSYSYDGEFAARVVKRWKIHAARGSSSRGGHEAVACLVEAAKTTQVTGFTLDGPKGPARVAKPGIAVVAARTRLPIVPNAFVVQHAWRLRSWDRFPIQKPFSRIVCAYAPAVEPPAEDTPEDVERVRGRVEEALNRLHRDLETELGISCSLPMRT